MPYALRLIGLFVRISILNELQYRANFFFQVFQSALAVTVAVGGLGIVFSRTETLRGWSAPELLLVVGIYFVIGGLIRTLIQPSMQRLMEDIRTGVLDYWIIKPAPTQFLMSIRQMQLWKLLDALIGVVLMAISLRQLGVTVGWEEVLAFGVMLLCGAVIVYSFWLALATITFWFIKIDNILVIFETMYEAGRWPVRIYPAWLEIVLTFLVPVAFAITVPAEAITGRLTLETVLGALALAAIMALASHLFWRRGLRAYSGASA